MLEEVRTEKEITDISSAHPVLRPPVQLLDLFPDTPSRNPRLHNGELRVRVKVDRWPKHGSHMRIDAMAEEEEGILYGQVEQTTSRAGCHSDRVSMPHGYHHVHKSAALLDSSPFERRTRF